MRTITKTIEAKPTLVSIEVGGGKISITWHEVVKENGKVISSGGGRIVDLTDELSPGQLSQLRGLITALVAAVEVKYPL